MIRAGTEYLKNVWQYRYFWTSLVRSDLRSRYRRSVLGVGWSLLSPLLMAGVLCVVYQEIFHLRFMEYGPFLLAGLAFWTFFSGAILQGCSCFPMAEPYIRQEPTPLIIYPLRTVCSLGIHMLISLFTVLTLTWICQGPGNWSAFILLVPALGAIFVLGLSVATLAAFANVYFPDLQHLAELGLQALFFLTPIIYPPKVLGERGLASLVNYNPLAILIQLLRWTILGPQALGAEQVDISQLATLFAFVVGMVIFTVLVIRRWEREVVFEL